jgi:hypothetical protein
MLRAYGDWMEPGSADENKPAKEGPRRLTGRVGSTSRAGDLAPYRASCPDLPFSS